MHWSAVPYRDDKHFLIECDSRLDGMCQFVGGKWNRRYGAYVLSAAQRSRAELLIDHGWLADGAYYDWPPMAYHVDRPEFWYWPEQMRDVLATIPQSAPRCRKTLEMPI